MKILLSLLPLLFLASCAAPVLVPGPNPLDGPGDTAVTPAEVQDYHVAQITSNPSRLPWVVRFPTR